jgi:hypothetical protein
MTEDWALQRERGTRGATRGSRAARRSGRGQASKQTLQMPATSGGLGRRKREVKTPACSCLPPVAWKDRTGHDPLPNPSTPCDRNAGRTRLIDFIPSIISPTNGRPGSSSYLPPASDRLPSTPRMVEGRTACVPSWSHWCFSTHD